MRTFISIELPENVKEEIVKIQQKLFESGLFTGKITEIENLHLTLKFLGEIDKKTLEIVKERLNKMKFDDFEVELDKVGVFDKQFIRIIWVSLKGEKLFELQREIDDVLIDLFGKEDRFMAHITIARPKFVSDRQKLLNLIEKIKFDSLKFKVDKFYLKKSELTISGPKYTNLMVLDSKEEI